MNELMRRARYQKILLVLLMLVFGGQAMASANIICQNQTSSPQSTELAMSDMADHSQHLGLNPPVDESSSLDCCPDCDCSVGGCSASAALPTTQNLLSIDAVLFTKRYNERAEGPLTTSLFRPPISR